jgi:hypothetical protein
MRTIRFPIAGLMLAVLVVALGLAALRNASEIWAGATFLLTCAVLTLAIVGVVCRDQSERAWWLGFALFGWGYLVLAFWSSLELPTSALLNWLQMRLNAAPPGGGGMQSVMLAGGFGGGSGQPSTDPFQQIGHCLWALLAALIGGVVSTLLFGGRRKRDAERDTPTQVAAQPPSRRQFWPAFFGLSGCVLIVCLGALGLRNSRSTPEFLVGAAFFSTCALLGTIVLAAAAGQGNRRQIWLGAALFGVGYMILAFGHSHDSETWPSVPTDHLLQTLRPWFPPYVSGFPSSATGVASANARILDALEQPVPMPFDDETPLEDVLKHIKAETRSPGGQSIQIYVNPIGLQEAEKTMTSTIRNIDLEGVPLKTSLRHLLDQLDLAYSIRGGLLHITSKESNVTPAYHDPFLIVGHCLLALLAAGFGAIVAALLPGKRRQAAIKVADRPAASTAS